jgi:phosphohistidine phosphatase
MTNGAARFLLLMRHGEAAEGSPDAARPLTERGHLQAKTIGERLIRESLTPDVVLYSEVRRAHETALSLTRAADLTPEILVGCGKALYHAGSAEDVLDVLRLSLPSSARTALVIGHNPAIYQCCALLASHTPSAVSDRLGRGYPPATLSVFQVTAEDWQGLHPARAEMIDLLLAP